MTSVPHYIRFIRVIKARSKRWAGHVVRVEERGEVQAGFLVR